MADTVTGILKKNQVRPAGAYSIGAGPTVPPAPGPAKAEVRLVEQHDDHATLEVRCACGRYTYIQCRWPITGSATPADPAKPRTNA